MAVRSAGESLSRGHRKKERTRGLLLEAGLQVLAKKGEGFTIGDVVTEAGVSNGTFYNYFVDRDALVDALAECLVDSIAEATAREGIADPALRFATATARMLDRAAGDATWGRVVLRLVGRPAVYRDLDQYLRRDLAEGCAQGRFSIDADDASVDQVMGLIVMTIRRMVLGEADVDTQRRAVSRALQALGLAEVEADALAREGSHRGGESSAPSPRA